jgi:hypothetical protein
VGRLTIASRSAVVDVRKDMHAEMAARVRLNVVTPRNKQPTTDTQSI